MPIVRSAPKLKPFGGVRYVPVLPNKIAVPEIRILRDASQTIKIHLDEAERRAVAASPLEIVQQRPNEIAAHVDALCLSFLHRLDVTVKEFDAPSVVNFAVHRHGVVEVGAVFGNVNRWAGIDVVEPKQHVAKLLWV